MKPQHRTSLAEEETPFVSVTEAVGELFSRFGLRPVLGKAWAALYLSSEPLTAQRLRRDLGVSSGSLSMGLSELMELGLVSRSTPPGRRYFVYSAEKETWTLMTRIFKERERARMMEILDRVRRAEERLDIKTEGEGESRYTLERVRHLREVGEFVIDLVDAFMERTRSEIKAAKKWFEVSERFGGEPLSRVRRRINRARNQRKRK